MKLHYTSICECGEETVIEVPGVVIDAMGRCSVKSLLTALQNMQDTKPPASCDKCRPPERGKRAK